MSPEKSPVNKDTKPTRIRIKRKRGTGFYQEIINLQPTDENSTQEIDAEALLEEINSLRLGARGMARARERSDSR